MDEWSARRRDRYLHDTQQTQEKNIHALRAIRTHARNGRTAADSRLRLHIQRGQLTYLIMQ
jgi:hypothetical protein